MKNYTQLVSDFRELARDQIRTQMINTHRTSLLQVNNSITEHLALIAKTEKQIAVYDYEIAHLDTDHPEYDDRKAAWESNKKAANERMEATKTCLKVVQEQADAISAKIADITEGKIKVDMYQLEETTNTYIRKFYQNKAKEASLEVTE